MGEWCSISELLVGCGVDVGKEGVVYGALMERLRTLLVKCLCVVALWLLRSGDDDG